MAKAQIALALCCLSITAQGLEPTNTWLNQFYLGGFGNVNFPQFSTIKYSGIVVFTFASKLQTFNDNASAITGGMSVNSVYQTSAGDLKIVT